jgi:hypothetical protein
MCWCKQVLRSAPDGSLLDVNAFMDLACSSLQVMGSLPPPMVQAINQRDSEALQNIFRWAHERGLLVNCTSAFGTLCKDY